MQPQTSTLADTCLNGIRRHFLTPVPQVTVSEWADRDRVIPLETSAYPGQWSTARTPYLQEPMDCFSNPEVREIVMMVASQVGKTEILLNMLGYVMKEKPDATLVVQPTKELMKEFSVERIEPMIRDTPALRLIVKDDIQKDARNKTLKKTFPGGFAALVGANVPADLASRPICNVLCDEVDRYPASSKKEGDPVYLAKKRTANYSLAKVVLMSTPVEDGSSRIQYAYSMSDRRKYYVPCFRCGEFQTLTFDLIKWPKKNGRHITDKAYYECVACKAKISNIEKRRMLSQGKWIADHPFNGIAGFGALGQVYSPFIAFKKLADEFLENKNDINTYKVFINTVKGETWKVLGAQVDKDMLFARREGYAPDVVPAAAGLLTASVDVQKDRLEVLIGAWGVSQELWIMSHHVFYGDPEGIEIWSDLENLLHTPIKHECGGTLQIKSMAIDTGGHHTQTTYSWVKGRERVVHAIKGADNPGRRFLTRPSKNMLDRGIRLFIIGTEEGKDLFTGRLTIKEPGRGYVHFNKSIPEEFFDQLKSEKRVTEYVKGKKRSYWKKTAGKANEAFDLMDYMYGAYYILNPVGLESLIKKLNKPPETDESKQKKKSKQRRGAGFVNKFK